MNSMRYILKKSLKKKKGKRILKDLNFNLHCVIVKKEYKRDLDFFRI